MTLGNYRTAEDGSAESVVDKTEYMASTRVAPRRSGSGSSIRAVASDDSICSDTPSIVIKCVKAQFDYKSEAAEDLNFQGIFAGAVS